MAASAAFLLFAYWRAEAERQCDDLAERKEINLPRRGAPPGNADAAARLGIGETQQLHTFIGESGIDRDAWQQRRSIAVGDLLPTRSIGAS
jgi:hypothetical protein